MQGIKIMAKNQLPSAEPMRRSEAAVDKKPEAVHIMGRTIETPAANMTTATTSVIELPLSSISTTGYVSKHVDVKLTREQCWTLRAVLRGLEDQDATLKNGLPVNNATRTVQYILEQISQSAEKPLFG